MTIIVIVVKHLKCGIDTSFRFIKRGIYHFVMVI